MKRNVLSAYTLVEITVVVAIIGILASLAFPRIASQKESAIFMDAVVNLRSIYFAEKTYWLEHNRSFAGVDADCGNLDYTLRSGFFKSLRCNVGGAGTGNISLTRDSASAYVLNVNGSDGSLTCPACPVFLQKLLP